jgi:hypothetical protein
VPASPPCFLDNGAIGGQITANGVATHLSIFVPP